MSGPNVFRQQKEDQLLELKLQKLQKERNEQSARDAQQSVEAVFSLLRFLFKHPKTTVLLIFIGYASLQFFAPLQGAALNSWLFTLFTSPRKALLIKEDANSISDNTAVPIPAKSDATVLDTKTDQQKSHEDVPPLIAPAPILISPACKQLRWSDPNDLPYLHYYKCPNPVVSLAPR